MTDYPHQTINKATVDLMLSKAETDTPTREEMAKIEDMYQAGEVEKEAYEDLKERYREAKDLERDVFDK